MEVYELEQQLFHYHSVVQGRTGDMSVYCRRNKWHGPSCNWPRYARHWILARDPQDLLLVHTSRRLCPTAPCHGRLITEDS